ncbi:unnamed protein product, partial [Mesorhabditis spiculigera]
MLRLALLALAAVACSYAKPTPPAGVYNIGDLVNVTLGTFDVKKFKAPEFFPKELYDEFTPGFKTFLEAFDTDEVRAVKKVWEYLKTTTDSSDQLMEKSLEILGKESLYIGAKAIIFMQDHTSRYEKLPEEAQNYFNWDMIDDSEDAEDDEDLIVEMKLWADAMTTGYNKLSQPSKDSLKENFPYFQKYLSDKPKLVKAFQVIVDWLKKHSTKTGTQSYRLDLTL